MTQSNHQASSATAIRPLAAKIRTAHSAVTGILKPAGRRAAQSPTASKEDFLYRSETGSVLRREVLTDPYQLHPSSPYDTPVIKILSSQRNALSTDETWRTVQEYHREHVTKAQVVVQTKTLTSVMPYSTMLVKIAKDFWGVSRRGHLQNIGKRDDLDNVRWRHFTAEVQHVKIGKARHWNVYARDDTRIGRWIEPSTSAVIMGLRGPSAHDVEGATHEGIAQLFRWLGKRTVAARIGELLTIAAEDRDEPRMSIESLRNLGRLLISEEKLTEPNVGVSPNGLLQAQWSTPENGLVAMEFLVSGLVRFSAISAPAKRGVKRKAVRGTLEHKEMLTAVQPFSERLFSK